MSLSAVAVEIEFDNAQVFHERTFSNGALLWCYHDDVIEWLKEHASGSYRTQSIHGDSVEQTIGVRFIFDHDSTAVLFKLTWGGR